jgi:protein-S-isoprenylcysteine O-methyltransferase Ste14
MADAPAFRVWPPVALGVPLLVGWILTATVGDPFSLSHPAVRVVGVVLCLVFVVWNGWTLVMMAANRTAVLPGGATRTILDRGPFRLSRNPLYVGLIILNVGLALLWPSAWAVLLVPVGVALLFWGAVLPEEHYLSARFGKEYDAYRRRVRRWI